MAPFNFQIPKPIIGSKQRLTYEMMKVKQAVIPTSIPFQPSSPCGCIWVWRGATQRSPNTQKQTSLSLERDSGLDLGKWNSFYNSINRPRSFYSGRVIFTLQWIICVI